VERCRAAGVPERELAAAMEERAARGAEPVRERERLLRFLEDSGGEERRAAHGEAVAMLHEAIRTGSEVPPRFEELVNELIVSQVL